MNSSVSNNSYDPLDDPVYMSLHMLSYFKNKLLDQLRSIQEKERVISLSLVDNPNREPDHVDQGTNEELHIEEFTFQEHEDRLRFDVEKALHRFKNGTYGYCEETGEEIGVRRLMAVPWARYCLEVQARKEHK